jgi:hypothetical protein
MANPTSKYASQLEMLSPLFPDWDEDALASVLADTKGNAEEAAVLMVGALRNIERMLETYTANTCRLDWDTLAWLRLCDRRVCLPSDQVEQLGLPPLPERRRRNQRHPRPIATLTAMLTPADSLRPTRLDSQEEAASEAVEVVAEEGEAEVVSRALCIGI